MNQFKYDIERSLDVMRATDLIKGTQSSRCPKCKSKRCVLTHVAGPV